MVVILSRAFCGGGPMHCCCVLRAGLHRSSGAKKRRLRMTIQLLRLWQELLLSQIPSLRSASRRSRRGSR